LVRDLGNAEHLEGSFAVIDQLRIAVGVARGAVYSATERD
jgi:hypothetical protein